MSRNLQLYLEDILNSSTKIRRYTQDMNMSQFLADERTFDAVIRNLQIIGEAVKNIPMIQVEQILRNEFEEDWLRKAIAKFSKYVLLGSSI